MEGIFSPTPIPLAAAEGRWASAMRTTPTLPPLMVALALSRLPQIMPPAVAAVAP